MEDLVHFLLECLSEGDPIATGCVVAFLVIAVTILIFAVYGRTNKRRGILLTGLCDGGKTLLFTRLVHKTYAQTHTSIKENDGIYIPSGKKKSTTLRIIDLPGHERIRYLMVDQYKHLARGIVYVVDSLTFQKEIKDVAEFLYNILTDPVISANYPPILIACNKHDHTLAKGAKVVQAQLEKEINTLRVTKSAALGGTDNSQKQKAFLGRSSKDFSFTDLKPLQVDFADISAQGPKEGKEADLAPLEEWLAKVA